MDPQPQADPFEAVQPRSGAPVAPPAPSGPDPFAAVQPPPSQQPSDFSKYYHEQLLPEAQQFYEQQLSPAALKHQGGLALRTGAEVIGGLPLLAMSAGVGARNLITGSDYELPNTTYEKWLSSLGMPEPQGWGEKGAMIAGGLVGGKYVPFDVEAPGAPANFETPAVTAAKIRAQVLQRAQKQGMVGSPSTTNPTWWNRTLETIAGKENVQNWARIMNDTSRQKVGARELGLNEDTPMTRAGMDAIVKEQGAAYQEGRQIPQFKTSSEGPGNFIDRMAQIEKENQGANESFPGTKNPDVQDVIDNYTQPTMTGNAVVDAVMQLRDKASAAFARGDNGSGRMYRQVQAALEDELERAGGTPEINMPNTVARIRAARIQIAKAKTIKEAMAPDGTITGPDLAQAWEREVPMQPGGPLHTAAEFAANFPKVNKPADVSGAPVSHLGAWAGLGGAVVGGEGGEVVGHFVGHPMLGKVIGGALGAGAPLVRILARNRLLSPKGQANAVPDIAKQNPQSWRFTPQQYAAAIETMGSPTDEGSSR